MLSFCHAFQAFPSLSPPLLKLITRATHHDCARNAVLLVSQKVMVRVVAPQRSSSSLSSSPFSSSLSLLLFLTSPLLLSSSVHHLTREEASHTGFLYHSPPIIQEFDAFLEQFSSSSIKHLNDFTQHHAILKLFCSQRLPSESCRWFEYFQLLDELRLPFLNLFDPGMRIGFKISELQKLYHSGSSLYQTRCEIIRNPSPNQFLEYVKGSKPVIIRGGLPSSFDSSSWSLSNLVEILGETEVSPLQSGKLYTDPLISLLRRLW